MGSTDNFFSGIDKVLDIVDEAISTNNYSNMANQIQKSVKPYSKKQLSEEERARLMRELEKWNARSKADTGRNLYKEGAGRTYNGGHMEGRGNAFYGSYDPGTGQTGTRSAGANAVVPVEDEYFRPAESTIGNNVMFGLGAAGTVMAGLPSIGMLAFTLMSSGNAQAGGAMLTSMMLAITAGFGALTYFGKRGANKKKRYALYREILEKNHYADVSDLAKQVGIPEEKIVAELRDLTKKGYFKQGHFDEQEKTFIADDKIYQQYLDTQANAAFIRREAEQRAKEENVISPEVREVLDRGSEYIAEIRRLNDIIPGDEVSGKLARMENIITKIFAEVRAKPSLASNLSMFMDYYLPTTTKLINAYAEMDAQPVQGENIRSAKKEIENSLDTINDAYENLLDSFFKDQALDVATDISVMKTMMKQEGLAPDDLEEIRRKEEMRKEIEEGPTLQEMQGAMQAYAYMKEGE